MRVFHPSNSRDGRTVSTSLLFPVVSDDITFFIRIDLYARFAHIVSNDFRYEIHFVTMLFLFVSLFIFFCVQHYTLDVQFHRSVGLLVALKYLTISPVLAIIFSFKRVTADSIIS